MYAPAHRPLNWKTPPCWGQRTVGVGWRRSAGGQSVPRRCGGPDPRNVHKHFLQAAGRKQEESFGSSAGSPAAFPGIYFGRPGRFQILLRDFFGERIWGPAPQIPSIYRWRHWELPETKTNIHKPVCSKHIKNKRLSSMLLMQELGSHQMHNITRWVTHLSMSRWG